MQFNVSVQNNFYKTITAVNLTAVIQQILADIKNGLVPNFDATRPKKIAITPVASPAG
jgi:hypothetical protein